MSRIKELKEKMKGKGFYALEPAEREEYKKLTQETPSKETPGEVTVSSEQFAALLNRVKQLEEEKQGDELKDVLTSGTWEIESDKFPQKKASLRVFVDEEGKSRFIVDYKEKSFRYNPDTQMKENWYTLQLLDKVNDDGSFETVPMEIEISDWAKLERVWLDIVGKDEKPIKKFIGQVEATEVDYENYRASKGDMVDQYEYSKIWTYTMQLPDGKKIKLNSNILNS